MVTVRFSHPVNVDGVWYHVGDQVSLDVTTAIRLRNSGYATILTGGVSPRDPTDPYPQYIDERELADALATLPTGGGTGPGGPGTAYVEDPSDPGFFIVAGTNPGTPPVVQGTPLTPETFSAAVASDTAITLTWAAASVPAGAPPVSGYRIYNAVGTLIRTLGDTTTTTFTGLSAGTTYTYSVAAVNAVGESPKTPLRSVTSTATRPTPPASLSATAASDTSVSLTWSASSVSAGGLALTGYRLYSGAGTFLATLGLVTSTTRTGLAPGTTYSFYVTAVNGAGESGASVTRTVTTTTSTLPVPNPPPSLSATSTSTSVTLSWGAATVPVGAPALTGYRVYRGGALQQTLGLTTSTTITGLVAGTTYSFLVTATNAAGESAPSVTRTVATIPGPGGPSGGFPGNLDPGDPFVFVTTLPVEASDPDVLVTTVPGTAADPSVLDTDLVT